MDLSTVGDGELLELHWAVRIEEKPLEWHLSGTAEKEALGHLILARACHDPSLAGALRNGGAGRTVLGLRKLGTSEVREVSERDLGSLYAATRDGGRQKKIVLARLAGTAKSTW